MKMLQITFIALLFPAAFMACKKDSDKPTVEGIYVGQLTQKNNSGSDTFTVKLTVQPANILELVAAEYPDSTYKGSWQFNSNILTGNLMIGGIPVSLNTTLNGSAGTLTGTWGEGTNTTGAGTINVARKEPMTIEGRYEGFIGIGDVEPTSPHKLFINPGNFIIDNDGYSGAGNLNGNRLTATLTNDGAGQNSYSISLNFDPFLGTLTGTWEDTDQPPHKGKIKLIKK